MTNEEIVDKGYVPDASLSKELWVLEDVKLKKVGKIKVLEAKEEPVNFTYGDDIKGETYYWNYEVIEEPIMNESKKYKFVRLGKADKHLPQIIKEAEKEWGSASEYFNELSSKRIAFKLIEGNNLVGFFSIIFADDTTGYGEIVPWLEKMYTLPDYRKKGLGTLMQQKAEEVAKQKGYNKMFLWTDLDNYYEKNNWKYETDWKDETGQELKLYSKDLKETMVGYMVF